LAEKFAFLDEFSHFDLRSESRKQKANSQPSLLGKLNLSSLLTLGMREAVLNCFVVS
jgi:hypothetical protein